MKYNLIDRIYYENNKWIIDSTINKIWLNTIDANKAIEAIIRSHSTEKDSFHYTITINSKIIWITWFYWLKNSDNIFWLNHHWILKEYRWNWYWLSTIHWLIKHVKKSNNINIKWLVELIPKWNETIKVIFKKLWFIELSEYEVSQMIFIDNIIKQGYYDTAFILKIKQKK